MTTTPPPTLGLKENWKQFSLLVLINALVGGMIGLERTIFPQFAAEVFGVSSTSAMLSFIVAFGITKALTNYFTGKWANYFGRRNLLIAGWILALPVPLLLITAESWSTVVLANVLLGASQGLAWSSTVVMKIDLVGPQHRGLAMGLNEFAGYFAVGVMAFVSGYIAYNYGITPYPFYVGIVMALLGLTLTLIWVKDTRGFVHQEAKSLGTSAVSNVFFETTFRNKTLSTVTQAGLVNNLNDGMIWGLLPVLLMGYQFNSEVSGVLTALYPAVWGIGQLFTGKMADVFSRKKMLFWGMLLQGAAILLLPFTQSFVLLAILAALLGLGTALVYPTFLVSIAAATHPQQRAESIGVFRLWRDLGYAIGALLSGIVADLMGLPAAIIMIGVLTLLSAGIIQIRMPAKIMLPLPAGAVELATLRQMIVAGKALQIVDVRNAAELETGFIPNAMAIPLAELALRLHELNPDALVVTVCKSGYGRSEQAAQLLLQHGFSSKWLLGGTNRWLGLEK